MDNIKLEHLKRWCDKHYDDTKVRVHPQNIPVEVLMNEVVGRLDRVETGLRNVILFIDDVRREDGEDVPAPKVAEPQKPKGPVMQFKDFNVKKEEEKK